MTVGQIDLYNGALDICGEKALANLSENRPARFFLDRVWGANGSNQSAINACLEQGLWNFALETAKFDADASITAAFGLRYVFAKPPTWVRTAMLCQDEEFSTPLVGNSTRDEAGYWYADITPIYVSWVSNSNNFGGNLALWPESFIYFFECYLAKRIIRRLTSDGERVMDVKREFKEARTRARSMAALAESTQFAPMGNWARARSGRLGSASFDRGSQNRLIG